MYYTPLRVICAYLSFMWEYKAEVIRVVDGDTVILRVYKEIDFGFKVKQTQSYEGSFRLIGIDTPELRGGTPETKAAGRVAKERLIEILNESSEITARTHKPDNFGRWLVELFIDQEGESVNEQLIREGHAVKM